MLIGALGLGLASVLLPGVQVAGPGSLVLASLLLGLVNAVVRPLVLVLTLPITIVTLGLFLLVINAAMLGLVAWLLPGFHIAGFFSAVGAALLVSFTGWLASGWIGPSGRVEVMLIDRRA
ncbi:MAG: phage holin family protein [Myxococcota bacterium]